MTGTTFANYDQATDSDADPEVQNGEAEESSKPAEWLKVDGVHAGFWVWDSSKVDECENWLVAWRSSEEMLQDQAMLAIETDVALKTVWVNEQLRGTQSSWRDELSLIPSFVFTKVMVGSNRKAQTSGKEREVHVQKAEPLIDAFRLLIDGEYADTWLVAYDDILDDEKILTDMHYEMRTVFVKNSLRGRKQRRDDEVRAALETVSELGYGHSSCVLHL